jgi:hypothetical protein
MPQAVPHFVQQRPSVQPSFQQQHQMYSMPPFGQFSQQQQGPTDAMAADPVGPRNKRKKKKGVPPGQVVQQPQVTPQSDLFVQPQVVVSASVPAGSLAAAAVFPEPVAVIDVPSSSEAVSGPVADQGKGKKLSK